ncbi:MAG: glycoside hydrolase family 25 protein [Ruminococcus sp.]|nr:glycoside hydrolase family 25 protein [Ruminococcus sp.]
MKNITKKILCTAICLLLGCSAISGCSGGDTAADVSKVSEQGEANSVSSGVQSVTDTTVKTTGGKIHINDSVLGEIWITELDNVPLNKLDNNNFTSDADFKYYSENGKPASLEGIDVSSYNGDIEWQKVKDSGIDFVIVRLGGRGYGDSGTLYADERAVEYLNGAKEAGLKVGAYFFSQATTNDEAREEADYAKEIIGDISLDFPLGYDWEIIKDEDARTDDVTAAQATECAAAFCEEVKQLGFKPMIYSPSRELYFKYDLSRLADYDIWYCEYSDVPVFYYRFSIWQYSKEGVVDGIDGTVDLNICFTSVADFA